MAAAKKFSCYEITIKEALGSQPCGRGICVCMCLALIILLIYCVIAKV